MTEWFLFIGTFVVYSGFGFWLGRRTKFPHDFGIWFQIRFAAMWYRIRTGFKDMEPDDPLIRPLRLIRDYFFRRRPGGVTNPVPPPQRHTEMNEESWYPDLEVDVRPTRIGTVDIRTVKTDSVHSVTDFPTVIHRGTPATHWPKLCSWCLVYPGGCDV